MTTERAADSNRAPHPQARYRDRGANVEVAQGGREHRVRGGRGGRGGHGDDCSANGTATTATPSTATAAPSASPIAAATATANHACQFEVCGDGKVDVDEGCDDGNDVDGDGCDRFCAVE